MKIIKHKGKKYEVFPIEQKGSSWDKIKYPKGFSKKNIPTQALAWAIYDNKCEDFDSGRNNFFVQQESKRLKELGRVAWLDVSSDWAYLYCDRDSYYLYSMLGVIFVRRIK